MKPTEQNSTPTVSYLLEHSHGTCELWVRQGQAKNVSTYEPLKLMRVSGRGTVLLRSEMIAEAICLEQWAAANPDVFTDGRTSFKQQ